MPSNIFAKISKVLKSMIIHLISSANWQTDGDYPFSEEFTRQVEEQRIAVKAK